MILGIGMPKEIVSIKLGLGSSILQALSAQLHGVIKVSDGNPGAIISIAYTQIAVVANDTTPVCGRFSTSSPNWFPPRSLISVLAHAATIGPVSRFIVVP